MRAFRTMSSISIASLQRIKADELAKTLRAEQAAGVAPADSRVAVVDVRDGGTWICFLPFFAKGFLPLAMSLFNCFPPVLSSLFGSWPDL